MEAICLKCLSKNPESRYATAGDLAREIRRFLADEPVAAYPEPWTVRLRRLMSRHRTLASVVLATLVVATASLAAATMLLKLANDRESLLRARAESSLNLALKTVDRFFSKVGDDRQLKARGLEKFQRDLLSQAKAFYEELPTHEGSGPRVFYERAWSDLRLARITEELGEPNESIRLASRALATFERLAAQEPAKREYREGIARALDSLGSHYTASRQLNEARHRQTAAVEAWEDLLQRYPGSSDFRLAVMRSLNQLGRTLCLVIHDQQQAQSVLRRTLVLCDQASAEAARDPAFQVARAEATVLLGYSLALTDFTAARPLLDQGLTLREQLAAENPESFELQSDLLDACVLIATAYSNARVAGEVPRLYEKVRRIGERLATEHPDIPRFAENRGLIELLSCIHLAQSGAHAQATAAAEAALARVPKLGLPLFYAACCYSLASDAANREARAPGAGPQGAALVRRYQLRAIELLREAGRTGLFTQPHQLAGLQRDDPDLGPLRHLEEFKKLVAEIEADARN